MSFLSELKRRNVFKVGISYIVTAWILLQLADIVLENTAAPGWVMQVFMLAMVIGFPLVLIFAWAFELTPDGIRREKDVDKDKSITHVTGQRLNRNIIIALVIAVILLLADRFLLSQPEPESTASSPEAPVAATQPAQAIEKSIAVLPFVDMSPEGDQAYFADGISEEILNVLVKTQSLKVAGRTSSFQFRGRSEDLRVIGEELGVEHILEGSIRKADNRVRITAQLVKANDGFHLWSETYDRELTDIFAIQDEIARAITDALAVELKLADTHQELVTASTGNMEAYDRYLEARGLIAKRLDFPRAINLLNEATALDPDFAEGWAANAQAHSLAVYYVNVDRDGYKKLAESMARKALELDPQLSMAHSALGDIHRDRYQLGAAQESYLRALALNPDDIEANEQYTQFLWRVGYFEEALKYSSRAVELDPLSWINLTVHAGLRYASGDYAGGWSDMQRALNIGGGDRDFPLRHAINMSISDGRIEQAVELMEAMSNSRRVTAGGPDATAYFEQFLPALRSMEDTLAFLESNLDESMALGFSSFWTTDIFWAAYYGDYALAEKIMVAGVSLDEQLSILDTSWFNYPIINPLYNSAAYKQLVKRIKLDAFWREHGFPAGCRPVGEDDFTCN
jgi:TolB-like protein/Tfp pilus assembly protein PilF